MDVGVVVHFAIDSFLHANEQQSIDLKLNKCSKVIYMLCVCVCVCVWSGYCFALLCFQFCFVCLLQLIYLFAIKSLPIRQPISFGNATIAR